VFGAVIGTGFSPFYNPKVTGCVEAHPNYFHQENQEDIEIAFVVLSKGFI
jgi:hypothetical protein